MKRLGNLSKAWWYVSMEIVCACGTKMQTLVGCFFGFFFPGMYFWSSREIHCMIQSPWLTVLQKPFWSSKKEAWFSELSKLFNSSRTCDCIHSTWDTERLISKDSCSQPFGNQKSTAVSIVQKKKLNCCALHFLPSLEGKWCCHINKLVCQRKKKHDELCVLTWKKCHANQPLLVPDPSICKAYHTVEMLACTLCFI